MTLVGVFIGLYAIKNIANEDIGATSSSVFYLSG